jgi:hypothetical protein
MIELPKDSVHAGVIGLRSLRLCMFLGELHSLQVDTANVGKAHLMAFTKDKLYIIAGPEFGDWQGSSLVIIIALYMAFGPVEQDGMKSLPMHPWTWVSIHAKLIQMFG